MSQSEFSINSIPAYKMAWGKLQSLNGELAEIDRYISQLNAEGPSEKIKELKARKVKAVLAGQNPDDVQITDYHEALNKSREHRSLLREAIEEQKRLVQEEYYVASKEISEKVKPQYVSIVREYASQLILLGKSIEKDKDFRDLLIEGQVGFTAHFRVMGISTLGDPRDRSSRFSAFLIEAVEYGYLTAKEVPADWQAAWFKNGGFQFEKPGLASTLKEGLKKIVTKKPADAEWTAES